MDKLDKIMREQKKLFERVRVEHGVDFGDDNTMIKNHILALNDEVAELQREIDWKWWTNGYHVNWDAVDEELIDIIFFTLQALILRGKSPDDVYHLYMKKLGINHERQDGKRRVGYKAGSGEYYENADK